MYKWIYTGQELDHSGFVYYNARYYDPSLGRFLQADTYLDGMNRYTYCGNNPIMYNDPTGHFGAGWHLEFGWDGNGKFSIGVGGEIAGFQVGFGVDFHYNTDTQSLDYAGVYAQAGYGGGVARVGAGYDFTDNSIDGYVAAGYSVGVATPWGGANFTMFATFGEREFYTFGGQSIASENNLSSSINSLDQQISHYAQVAAFQYYFNANLQASVNYTMNEPFDLLNYRDPFGIYAVQDGRIMAIRVGDSNPYGNRMYIKHNDGSVTLYAHLHSITGGLSEGSFVRGGYQIGVMGSTGTTSRHLHFSYFAPGVTSYFPENATDGRAFIRSGFRPANTSISNEYGSNYYSSALRRRGVFNHEGIDFSGKLINLLRFW